MTTPTPDDEMWDDLFHGCAWAAFVDQATEERGPPDPELTRRRAYRYYEEELAASKCAPSERARTRAERRVIVALLPGLWSSQT